jgi:hypothetical protein
MLASRFGHWWEPRFHYNAFVVVVLLAAGVDGVRRFNVRRPLGSAWATAVLVIAIALAGFFPMVSVLNPDNYQRDARMRAAAAAVAAVPSGALVEAPNALGPQLSGRARVLLWDQRPRWAPWVIADIGSPTFPFFSVTAQRDRLTLLLRTGYHVVHQDAGFIVLTR